MGGSAMSERIIAALLLGIATVFGFAPFNLSGVPILTLAGLFALWQGAPSARAAAWQGFAFGMGLFGAGVSWVYIALDTFGGMPAVLAAIATAGFCAYLALFPALAAWATARLAVVDSSARLALAAALWTIAEWLRGWILSGFPWVAVGYAQVPTALSGYAPIGGVFLVSLIVAASAALLVQLAAALERQRQNAGAIAAVTLAALWGGSVALAAIEWSRPAGEATPVSLLQGNVAQHLKFEPGYRDQSLAIYAELVAQSRGRLIVLPESALPMFADEVPAEYVAQLRADARQRGGDLLLGLFLFEPREPDADEDRYYNSVVSIGSATTQVYRKVHLVPFGETIPAKPLVGWFIRSVLHIPLADQTPGSRDQAPLAVAGERVAVNICYEDAFGNELSRQLPEATLLVNVTNDAWYGRSIAAEQHNQMAAMRAIETARPMLRATNTGITSIIDHRGIERARLPWFTRGVLEYAIAGRSGVTPYVRFGDALAAVIAFGIVAVTLFGARLRR
jgi:apolipoprotein N-acyltransferase